MKIMANYEIRMMRQEEMDFAIELAAAEGWNPGLHDANCFYYTDPGGFFVGLLNGRIIGCISAVSYDGVFGFLGLYIIAPEYRGRGYGIQMWNKAIQRLEGHNIGLDGVVEQQHNYIKSGFKLAYRNIRYEGAAGSAATSSHSIVDLCSVKFDDLCTYDRYSFPANRDRFLRCWVTMPGPAGVAYVEDSRIRGYGLIRWCRRGYKIGPLFADTPEIGESIFLSLTTRAPEGSPIFLDIPEVNPFAVNLANRYRMKKVFETARMYTKEVPSIRVDRIFGVTTFELG